MSIQLVIQNSELVNIMAIYSSPDTTFQTLQQFLLNDIKVTNNIDLLLGDFNIDILSKPKHSIVKYLNQHQQIVSEPTTEYHSLLDHAYVKKTLLHHVRCDVLETYFSDHKPVLLSILLERQ